MRTVLLALLILSALASAPAYAQVLYGSIVGAVTDPSGSAVPSATVSIVHRETGQKRETTSGDAGLYAFSNVLAGSYDLTVSASGFRQATRTNVQVTINTVSRVDLALEVGQVTEQVTVEAASVTLQTDKADVHVELGETEVRNLPLPRYRNYQTLINLVPGATPGRFQNAISDTPGRALTTNINGTNRNNNITKLDGAVNVNIWLPHHTNYVAPAETIETVNISTNNFDAEQGLAGGAAVTVATKSGTNSVHGSAFALHDNSVFGAKNFFFRDPKTPKSLVNIDGFTLGGPIRKNRLFYFGGWEGTRERINRSRLFTVPAADLRAGDFTAYRTTIYDPATGASDGSARTPFAGNRIPVARQSAISRKLHELIPLPNQPGDNANFFNSGTQLLNRDNLDVKINFNRSSTHTIWGKYSAMDAQVVGEFGLARAGGPCLCDGGNGTGDTLVQLATIGQTWTFSPTFLWDATIGWSRMGQVAKGPDFGANIGLDFLGIPGTNGPDQRQSGFPIFTISGYTSLGNSEAWTPLFRNDTSFTTSQNFGWVRGAHDIRFGFEGTRHHLNHWNPHLGPGPRGTFNFNQTVTGVRGTGTNQFNGWASYLLGLPTSAGKGIQWTTLGGFEYQLGWYFRDRWQVNRKLTLSLGIRYELFPLLTRAGRGGIEQWDENTNLVRLGGAGGNPKGLGITTSRRLFAPRVGIAYRVNDWLVVRTGYGITYNPMPQSRPLQGMFPLTIAQDFQAANTFVAFQPLERGIPGFSGPPLDAGSAPLPSAALMRTIAGNQYKRGYVQSWNLILEQKLPGGFVTSVGYVGTQTVRASADWNANNAPPGTGAAGRPFFARFGRITDTLYFNGMLSANYHSLQTTINRRVASGLTIKGAYTYSKAINMTDEEGWAGLTFNHLPQFSRNRARAGYDIPHMLQMAYIYEMPLGKGKARLNSGPGAAVLGNWQFNGIFSSIQGRPFTVAADGGALNAPGNGQTADQAKSTAAKLGSLDEFFEKAAFAPVTTARFGSTGRNLLRGPGLVNMDLSLFRDFPLREWLTLQFRAEAFNLTNTPHFGNPGNNVNAASFMRITAADSDQRTVRFGLRAAW